MQWTQTNVFQKNNVRDCKNYHRKSPAAFAYLHSKTLFILSTINFKFSVDKPS
jgi:hypothetical protein